MLGFAGRGRRRCAEGAGALAWLAGSCSLLTTVGQWFAGLQDYNSQDRQGVGAAPSLKGAVSGAFWLLTRVNPPNWEWVQGGIRGSGPGPESYDGVMAAMCSCRAATCTSLLPQIRAGLAPRPHHRLSPRLGSLSHLHTCGSLRTILPRLGPGSHLIF